MKIDFTKKELTFLVDAIMESGYGNKGPYDFVWYGKTAKSAFKKIENALGKK